MSTITMTDPAKTVGSIYEAFSRGDIPFIMNHIAGNCQWTAAGKGFLPYGGIYRGQEAAKFFMELNEELEFKAFNPVSIHNIGDKEAVAFGNMTTTSKKTGKSLYSDWAMHWKFNDEGKVVNYQDYHDTAAAAAANQV